MKPRRFNSSIIGALIAAAMLLAAGVLMAVYEEHVYSAQQVKNVREQAQILAASVSAAIVFDDRRAAQEYVDALAANPELQAAGVYDDNSHLLAGFARAGTRLPAAPSRGDSSFGDGFVDVTAPVAQNGAAVGTVMLRAITEPAERRIIRYGGGECQAAGRDGRAPQDRRGAAPKPQDGSHRPALRWHRA